MVMGRTLAWLPFAAALVANLLVRLPLADPSRSAESSPRALRAKGNAFYKEFRFAEAERAYSEGFRRALASKDRAEELRLLINLGSVRFATFRYREAMDAFIEASRRARRVGDERLLTYAISNLSSLYLQQQDVNASIEAAKELLDDVKKRGVPALEPLVAAQLAVLFSRSGDAARAEALFRQAAFDADAKGDPAALALVLDQLGYERLKRGDVDAAEDPFVRAYLIRRLSRSGDIQYSYYALGLLHMARNDGRRARVLLDRCLTAHAERPGTLELWRVLYERGRARLISGDPWGALGDLTAAAASARRIRAAVIPADTVWVNTGADQEQLYSVLVRTAGALALRTGRRDLARRAFDALEENRAFGLRAMLDRPADWSRRLPPEYWEALARLRTAEARLSPSAGLEDTGEVRRLRYRITELEAEAGLSLFTSGDGFAGQGESPLKHLRGSLDAGEAYFRIYLDEPTSYLWAVTREAFHLIPLAGRGAIETQAAQFVAALRRQDASHLSIGAELFRMLFGRLPAAIAAKPRWSLALDGALWFCPMGALAVDGERGAPVYLTERRTIRLVPAAVILGRRPKTGWRGGLLGVADAVYNEADPRRFTLTASRSAGPTLGILPRLSAGSARPEGFQLARLAASRKEVERCFTAWRRPVSRRIILSGEAATVEGVRNSLADRPSLVHFATHFVMPAAGERQAQIALSLDDKGVPQYLGPSEIARWRVAPRLVVLSGCSSAAAEILPAEGLMGMTRGWLAAGAGSVVATLWPTPDDEGRLLVAFYENLAGAQEDSGWAAPEALSRAQRRMLELGGPGADPSMWAAYFITGME